MAMIMSRILRGYFHWAGVKVVGPTLEVEVRCARFCPPQLGSIIYSTPPQLCSSNCCNSFGGFGMVYRSEFEKVFWSGLLPFRYEAWTYLLISSECTSSDVFYTPFPPSIALVRGRPAFWIHSIKNGLKSFSRRSLKSSTKTYVVAPNVQPSYPRLTQDP